MDNVVAGSETMIKELEERVRVILDFILAPWDLNVTTIIGFLKYVPMHYSDQITCIAQFSGEWQDNSTK